MVYRFSLVLGLIYSIVLYNTNIIIPVLFTHIEYFGSFLLSIALLIIIFFLGLFFIRTYIDLEQFFEFSTDDIKDIMKGIFIRIFLGLVIGYLLFVFIVFPIVSGPVVSFLFKIPIPGIDYSIPFLIYEILNDLYYAFEISIVFFLLINYKLNAFSLKKPKKATFTGYSFLIYPYIFAFSSIVIDLVNQIVYLLSSYVISSIYNSNFYTSIIIANLLYLIKIVLLIFISLYVIFRYKTDFELQKFKTLFIISFLAILSAFILGSFVFAPFFGQVNLILGAILQDFIWGFYLNCLLFAVIFLRKIYPDFEIF